MSKLIFISKVREKTILDRGRYKKLVASVVMLLLMVIVFYDIKTIVERGFKN